MVADYARTAMLESVKDKKEYPEKFTSDLKKIAMTTLDSKILSHDKEHFPVLGSRLENVLFRCKRITGMLSMLLS
ncbi:T-complex protein 1 subunit beta [Tanacetum coccineum]